MKVGFPVDNIDVWKASKAGGNIAKSACDWRVGHYNPVMPEDGNF